MKSAVFFISLIIAFILPACEDDDNGTQPENEIQMTDSEFVPDELTVTAGTAVRWVNTSNVTHTVTSADGLFDQVLEVDDEFVYTFNEPGTYFYTCTIHVGMSGSVIVE